MHIEEKKLQLSILINAENILGFFSHCKHKILNNKVCTVNIKFDFLKSYCQVDGVDMGSPVGSVLADIFMIPTEKNNPMEINYVVLYHRYVDDIPIITINRRQVESIDATMSRANSSILVSLGIIKLLTV